MRKLFLAFQMLIFVGLGYAQEKYDEVLLTNGVEYIGKVSEINEKEVKFSHKGETLVYTIPRTQIFRIAFASGRTEVFQSVANNQGSTGAAEVVAVNRNMVAILPFRFVSNKTYPGWQDMAYKIQEEAYLQAMASIPRYSFQLPATTNAILLKKGIDPQQLRAYTMDEIANLLGVGYVMSGEVSMRSNGFVQSGTQTVYQNNNNTVTKPGGTSTTTSTTTINNNKYVESFATTVSLKIHNETGSVIYTKSRESVWSVPDAYKATLNYLLKRTGL